MITRTVSRGALQDLPKLALEHGEAIVELSQEGWGVWPVVMRDVVDLIVVETEESGAGLSFQRPADGGQSLGQFPDGTSVAPWPIQREYVELA